MPANHCVPHTAETRAKMSAAHKGKPAPWKRRPTRDVDGIVHYRCGRCAGFFPREEFPKERRTILGIKSNCRPCHSIVSIASRNPATTRANAQRAEAARRARKANADGRVTAADWREVLAILGRACLACASDDPPTQDHVVPLSRGGLHHPTNLQPLCRRCNEKKQARTIDYRTPQQREALSALWVVEFRKL